MNVSSRLNRHSADLILLTLSLIVSLIIGEGILRTISDPVDYLMPYFVTDNILGVRVKTKSVGHDDWGYRNKAVPRKANIVAIGDSQTYGVEATASNSWPAVLQKITHKTVYNLSLGAYDPVHYFYLLENQAIKLKPSLIVVGFYYGNDIIGAYNTTYGNNYWKHLRRASSSDQGDSSGGSITMEVSDSRLMASLRSWLAHHSVLYRLLTYSLGDTLRFFELKYGHSDDHITILEDRDAGIRVGLTPILRLGALNLDNPRVQEGLRISLELFAEMNKFCKEREIGFRVVLIPTKESVYSELVKRNKSVKNFATLLELFKNECRVNELVKGDFRDKGIPYTEVLEPLRSAVGLKSIYPSNQDGHPLKEGYAIIAETIRRSIALKENTLR